MPLANNIQKILNSASKSPGFNRVLNGMRVLSAEPGKVVFEMEVKKEHLNGGGTLHGGLICTLVDNVSTFAVATTKENKLGVSVDLNVTFLAAAFVGEMITVESEVLRTGRTLAYANVNIFKDDGKLIATGRHTKYLDAGAKLSDFKNILSVDSDT